MPACCPGSTTCERAPADGVRAVRRCPTAGRDYVTQSSVDRDAKFGGDFKIGLTNDLIADLTYHTDFAQVEADQEVVNLTRFSLFFPEQRQFFTESAGIFDFGKSASGLGGEAAAADPGLLALFYSRRIGLADGQEVPILAGGVSRDASGSTRSARSTSAPRTPPSVAAESRRR